jgi:hypothetical protein
MTRFVHFSVDSQAVARETVFVGEIAYLSLGSNLGDRAANLLAAVEQLRAAGRVLAVSALYETQPVDVPDQPWFLNCALAVETQKTPRELLQLALQVEAAILGDNDPAGSIFRARDGGLLFRELRPEKIDERPRLRAAGGASPTQTQKEIPVLSALRNPADAWPCPTCSCSACAEFPHHGLDFASDARMVRQIGGRLLVDEVGVHQRLVALGERTEGCEQVTVHERSDRNGHSWRGRS